ncbi:MAG: transposase [Thermoanaerobaculia bacterium]|jgi:transposase-like protein|nr:transposase [Thermoanaerobaculia bacterium]
MSKTSGDVRARTRRFENREHPTATRFSAEFREEVVALARGRRALGVPVARIAAELGVRTRTLALWLRTAPKRRLRRVKLAPDATPAAPPATSSTMAVTVGPVRVEGLDFESVVRLVRVLA